MPPSDESESAKGNASGITQALFDEISRVRGELGSEVGSEVGRMREFVTQKSNDNPARAHLEVWYTLFIVILYVCVYVCIYVYMYMYVKTYMHTCMHKRPSTN